MKPLLPLALLLGLGMPLPAQTPASQPAPAAAGGGQTIITSDTLDLNLSKTKGQKQGLFRGNVKVDEPRFTMASKEMTVFFAEDDSVQDVEAREDVVIKRKDGTSETWSEKAIYNPTEKKLTLLKVTKQPKAVSQDKTVFADKIIFFPEEDKMLTEGASRVMLQKP
jgi:lipopolysaccharide export system protein LptA